MAKTRTINVPVAKIKPTFVERARKQKRVSADGKTLSFSIATEAIPRKAGQNKSQYNEWVLAKLAELKEDFEAVDDASDEFGLIKAGEQLEAYCRQYWKSLPEN